MLLLACESARCPRQNNHRRRDLPRLQPPDSTQSVPQPTYPNASRGRERPPTRPSRADPHAGGREPADSQRMAIEASWLPPSALAALCRFAPGHSHVVSKRPSEPGELCAEPIDHSSGHLLPMDCPLTFVRAVASPAIFDRSRVGLRNAPLPNVTAPGDHPARSVRQTRGGRREGHPLLGQHPSEPFRLTQDTSQ
jgi:hypothetical protein